MLAAKTLAVTAWIFGLHIRFILAVDLGASIIGCSELKCPPAKDLTPLCRVANHTSTVIGLTNLDSPVSETDLTWTKGVRIFQDAKADPPSTTYENDFYLGTSAGFDLSANATKSNYGACALFFIKVSDQVKFEGNITTSVGTCSNVMTMECLNAVLRQATNAVNASKGSSVADTCQALESDFNDNLVSQCSQFATGDKWDGLHVQALTGPDAPKPITGTQNSTSNCHPTLPQSNLLSLIASINTTSTALASDILANLYGITPILTVFFPQSNASDSAILKQAEAQLTCLKSVGDLGAPNATSDNGQGTKAQQNEAMIMGMPKTAIIGLMAAYAFGILI